jgi:hypothetical protein
VDQAGRRENALHSCCWPTRVQRAAVSEKHQGRKMDLKEAIYTRRAVREFTAEPVGEQAIRDLIDAAIQAPSAVNAQPCRFCVVHDKGVLATISREAKAHMVRTTPIGLMSHHFNEILNDANFDIFYHAPVLIVISTVADIPWAVEDSSLAAENLMLAARGAGLVVKKYNLFILEVLKAWIDPTQKNPKTIHHRGYGTFVVDGETIKLKSRMR